MHASFGTSVATLYNLPAWIAFLEQQL